MRSSLQRRLFALVAVAMALMLASLTVFAVLSVQERVDDIIQQQQRLAETTAGQVHYVLQDSLEKLNEASLTISSSSGDSAGIRAILHDLYLQSPFTGGIFLLDAKGRMVMSEPSRPSLPTDFSNYQHIKDSLTTRRPVVSDYYKLEPTGEPLVSVAMPWTKGGQLAGVIVGNVDLTGSSLQSAIQLPHIGANGEYADLIDRQGTIIASTNISRVLTRSVQADDFGSLISRKETRGFIADRNDAAEPEIVAFFPLSRFVFLVPWGVAVRQMESEALIPAWTLQRQFYLVGMSILVVGLVFTWGLARSIVRPVAFLNESARKIASGNLADPVPVPGEDELGMLARSFDAMRQKLKASLDRIQEWNRELERTVQERTGELEVAREIEAELLRRLISAQEEERRRIARELHDDTSQSLTALVLTLDTISLSPTLDDKLKTRVAFMKSITVNLLEGIRQMIFDLRPAMLDDLGLVPAVSWYAEQRLKPSGVRVAVESSGGERRLPQGIEIALFRVAQEALTNIVKHAGAESALIAIDINDTEAFLEIEDDGRGFNPREATRPSEKGQGLGLLGMKERVAALGGTISISSREGHGTSVKVHIPLEKGTV